ncbi:hypothetical protein XENTR_v10005963 [Xenopus tropicalis]|nr:hypothetical protein XENTR_v10005963 [Xenopus tropicalis]
MQTRPIANRGVQWLPSRCPGRPVRPWILVNVTNLRPRSKCVFSKLCKIECALENLLCSNLQNIPYF